MSKSGDREAYDLLRPLPDSSGLELAFRLQVDLVREEQVDSHAHLFEAHSRNIYGKLGVHSRTRAVAKARALGLLSAT